MKALYRLLFLPCLFILFFCSFSTSSATMDLLVDIPMNGLQKQSLDDNTKSNFIVGKVSYREVKRNNVHKQRSFIGQCDANTIRFNTNDYMKKI